MGKIKELDRHVAELIAAGEVVERPASVIKELVENSIDAGAKKITVEIKNGGMSYMRVTDDGSGMDSDDAKTAFLRHATSKLRDERGLEAIYTLGFRGEALAAIASVSKAELLTREQGADAGTSVFVEGGILGEAVPAGCPVGTTIIIRDLFFNTPARLKFMKTDRAEGAAVSSCLTCAALSHPEVSFRYIKDGKEEFHTPGDTRPESCIYSLFGREFMEGLLSAEAENERATVSGFVSSPAWARGNRTQQYFFVNGRVVRSRTLQAALEQAYRNSLFTGRFPSCVLYLTVKPNSIDVNVHPTKTEIKFLDEKQVFDVVYYAALAAVNGETKAAGIELSASTSAVIAPAAEPLADLNAPQEKKSKNTAGGGFFKTMDSDKFRSSFGGGGFKTQVPASRETSPFLPVRDGTIEAYATKAAEKQISIGGNAPEFRIIGEARSMYIIVEEKENIWIIDKHAAHERILFDKLRAETYQAMSQPLLMPCVFNIGQAEEGLLEENAELLDWLGFEVESFGHGSVAVRRIPSDIDIADAEATLSEICESLKLSGTYDAGKRRDDILHTVACKAAIKAGKNSDLGELSSLVEKVLSGQVMYCPHGRPVAFELTKNALDRNFKRT